MYANYAKRRGFLTDQKKENVEAKNVREKGKNTKKIYSPRGGVHWVGLVWVVVLWVWEWFGLLCCGCGSGLGLGCCGCGSGWVVVWGEGGGGGEGGGAAVGFLNFFMVYCLFLAGSNAGTLCGGAAWLDKDNNKLAQDFYGSGGGRGRGDLLFRISLQLTICLFTMLVCHQTGADRETAGGRQVDRQTER